MPNFTDWKGQYWSNKELQGNPTVVRNDTAIDFDWGTGAPGAGLPSDRFSIRWERWVNLDARTYTFYAQADNGIRVYMDGAMIIDEWYTNSEEIHAISRSLSGSHHLVIEYYENGGPALARFWWE